MIENIRESLISNPYLTQDVKDNFIELATIFNKAFPSISLDNLIERFKTLKVIRGSKFLLKGTSHYNPIDNELLISISKINDDIDCKHIMMRELLNILTAKENYYGFNQNNELEALNIGYTEILTTYLVGNDSICEYEEEIIAANLVGKIVGEDTLNKAYFNNDASLIMNAV